MTDLQISLSIAGSIFIVGVFSYNKWQEHKAQKSVERAFSSEHDDVLMKPDTRTPATPAAGQRFEPTLEPTFEAGASSTALEPGQAGTDQFAALHDPEPKELPIDELIDWAIPLE